MIKTQEAEEFLGRVKNISYFLDHVEAVRMCMASASSQACRPVSVARIQCLFERRLNNPPYFLGEPTTPLRFIG